MKRKIEAVTTARQDQLANELTEEIYSFKIEPNRPYNLIIYYQGEKTHDENGEETCSYYDAFLSIAHTTFLAGQFECTGQQIKKNVKSFKKDLPALISDRDFNRDGLYEWKEFVEFKIPQDWKWGETIS